MIHVDRYKLFSPIAFYRGWILDLDQVAIFVWCINRRLSAWNINLKYDILDIKLVIVCGQCVQGLVLLPQSGKKKIKKKSLIAGIMWQKSSTISISDSIYVPCPSVKQEVISFIHGQFDKMGWKVPVLTERNQSRDESSFCLSSSQPLPGWPDTVCCASPSTTATAHWPWG